MVSKEWSLRQTTHGYKSLYTIIGFVDDKPPEASILHNISVGPGFGTGTSSQTGSGFPLCFRHANIVVGISDILANICV